MERSKKMEGEGKLERRNHLYMLKTQEAKGKIDQM